ncbi:MAG: hypothetical protein JSR39_00620 [Verrucomicrobia bacterium]|nr:hypothetical protein [Verrucomicrobiota bacterium]
MTSSISRTESKKHFLRSQDAPRQRLHERMPNSKFHHPTKSSGSLSLKFNSLPAQLGKSRTSDSTSTSNTTTYLKKRKAESETELKVEGIIHQDKRPCRHKRLSSMLDGSVVTEAAVLKQFVPQTEEASPKVAKKRKTEEDLPAPVVDDYDPTYFELFNIQVGVEYTSKMHIDPSCKTKLKKCWEELDVDNKIEINDIVDPTDRESERYIACIKGSKENGIDPWTKRYEVKWIGPDVGYGLFAKTGYKKDEVIGVYAGDLTSAVKD